MRLETELRQDDDGAWYAHDPDPYQARGAVARDAAAAHALMMAMGELRKNQGLANCHRDGAPAWIKYRADKLMREWGFDSGEVE